MKWAARGFADPAAAALFIAALVVLIGRDSTGPNGRFSSALGAGFLFALALWVRPNLAPAAGILLGGAGLAALWQWQIARVTGLCIGFLPVLGMALHNWVFGHVFVLFSSNATIAEAVPMPPSAYVAAMGELLRLDLAGGHVRMWLLQWARWLAGPSESFLMIPLNAAAIVVLILVAARRTFDPWLRLIAAAALVQHTVRVVLSVVRPLLLSRLVSHAAGLRGVDCATKVSASCSGACRAWRSGWSVIRHGRGSRSCSTGS